VPHFWDHPVYRNASAWMYTPQCDNTDAGHGGRLCSRSEPMKRDVAPSVAHGLAGAVYGSVCHAKQIYILHPPCRATYVATSLLMGSLLLQRRPRRDLRRRLIAVHLYVATRHAAATRSVSDRRRCFYFIRGRGRSIAVSVCPSVCLVAYLRNCTSKLLTKFLYMLSVASADEKVIRSVHSFGSVDDGMFRILLMAICR